MKLWRFKACTFWLVLCFLYSPLFAAGFKYKALTAGPRASLIRLTDKFEKLGFKALILNPQPQEAHFVFDQVFVSLDWKAQIFAKLDVTPDDPQLQGAVVKLAEGFVYHSPQGTRRAFALYFHRFSRKEVLDLLKDLDFATGMALNQRFKWPKLIETAEAASCWSSLKSIEDVRPQMSHVQEVGLLDKASSCAIDAWNGTRDQLESYRHLIATLLNDPGQLWTKAVTQFGHFAEFIRKVPAEMRDLSDFMAELDFETRARIICGLAGHLAPHAALAAVGTGTIQLSLRFTSAVAKLKEARKALLKLNTLKKVGQIGITSELIRHLLADEIPKEVFDLTVRLVENNQKDAAMGIISCEP